MWYSLRERGVLYPLMQGMSSQAAQGLMDIRLWVMGDAMTPETVNVSGMNYFAYISAIGKSGSLLRYSVKVCILRPFGWVSTTLIFDSPSKAGIVSVRNSRIVDGVTVSSRGVMLLDTDSLPGELGSLTSGEAMIEPCCVSIRGAGVQEIQFIDANSSPETLVSSASTSFSINSGEGVRLSFAANTLYIEASPGYNAASSPTANLYADALVSFGGLIAGADGDVPIVTGNAIKMSRSGNTLSLDRYNTEPV